MSNDLYKNVLFNDGEGITHGDLNDAQRFVQAELYDQVLQGLIGKPGAAESMQLEGQNASGNAATKWAYCPAIGGGAPVQGSTNTKLKISPGTLFQKVASSDGLAPTLLSYTFDGTLEFTIANGDATHPRVDMLQMKLEYEDGDLQTRDFEDGTTHAITSNSMNKKHRVKATVNVKTGTPAVSPTYPTPDAGYVPIACVVVNTLYVGFTTLFITDAAVEIGGHPVAVIHDLRMPLKIRPLTVRAPQFLHNATHWAPSAAAAFDLKSDGTASFCAAVCPETKCRLVGVAASVHQTTLFPAGLITRLTLATDSLVDNDAVFDISDIFGPGAASNSNALADLTNGGTDPAFVAGPTVNGTATYDLPVWGNGQRAYAAQDATAVADQVCVAVGAETDFILYAMTFYVATGL